MNRIRPLVLGFAVLAVAAIAAAQGGCSKGNKGTNPMPTPESFNSGDLTLGVPFTHTFNTAGTYPYRCVHHSSSLTVGMVGTVVVDDNSANMGASVGVGVGGNFFSPASVTIKTGTTVTWNLNSGTHTVTRP